MNNEERHFILPIPVFIIVLLATLKIAHIINIDWIWILSPIWIPALLSTLLVTIIGLVLFFATRHEKDQEDNIE